MEAHDQELSSIKNELRKLLTMEEKLSTISKNMEGLQAQSEKTHQMMWFFMESMTKERSTTSGKAVESLEQENSPTKSKEEEGSISKAIRNENQEKKNENDDRNSNRHN